MPCAADDDGLEGARGVDLTSDSSGSLRSWSSRPQHATGASTCIGEIPSESPRRCLQRSVLRPGMGWYGDRFDDFEGIELTERFGIRVPPQRSILRPGRWHNDCFDMDFESLEFAERFNIQVPPQGLVASLRALAVPVEGDRPTRPPRLQAGRGLVVRRPLSGTLVRDEPFIVGEVADERGGGYGTAAPRAHYLLVRLGESIPTETGASPVHLSHIETGAQWRNFLRYGTGGSQVALSELLRCPCCLGIMRKPVGLPCGHSLCHGCLTRIPRDGSQSRRCPLCRRGIPQGSVHPNLVLDAVCDGFREFEEMQIIGTSATLADRCREFNDTTDLALTVH